MLPVEPSIVLTTKWVPLATFQANVAQRWLTRGRSSDDVFARFFFYFAGLNALYFLWGKVDDVRNSEGKPAGEERQIHDLLRKLPAVEAEQVLGELDTTVCFFQQRRPIQRMDRRGADNPIDGEAAEGTRWRKRLQDPASVQRLVALGSILYLVRSNLVHGSKMEAGDDQAVVEHAVPALKLLLEKFLALTQAALRESNR